MPTTERPSPSLPIRLAIEHPWRIVVGWLLLLAASTAVIASLLGGALNNEQAVTNNPESEQGLRLIEQHFDDEVDADEVVVVASSKHRVGDRAFEEFLARVAREGEQVGVTVLEGGTGNELPTSGNGRAVLVPLTIDGSAPEDRVDDLVEAVTQLDAHPDFTVDVTGDYTRDHDLTELSERDLREGELYVGLPVAMLVLLLVFGTVVGALLPIAIAIAAIICALALAALVGQQWELNLFVVNMISGMGLALGIDYSLFVLSRYREERTAGSARDAAIRTTGATASRAVLFSGMTFVVALVGMLLIPTTVMRSLAAGAILVGITAVAAALTLLPALLRLLGDRVDAFAVPVLGRRSARSGDGRNGFWAVLVRRVMRRPLAWGGAVALLLLVAAVPLAAMETGASGIATFPEDLPSARGYAAMQEHFPEQTLSPARIVLHSVEDDATLELNRAGEELRRVLATDDRFGDVHAGRPGEGPEASIAQYQVSVGVDALSSDAVEAVRDLRGEVLPGVLDRVDAEDELEAYVTGETAFNIDYFDVMREWLAPVLAFVLGLSFLILLVVFRSLAVPIVAIGLNLLSVGATYGLLVLVFQHGVGAELLGLRQVDTTEAWVPLFLFSVLFGLSMDYHMFLMTRIRERWAGSTDTADAVAWGVGTTGRIITGAALIIVAVFVGFAVGDLVMFQQMGFGIAVALLIDATLVRGVLLPAAMALLGDHNWYLPSWLQWLPEVQLEAEPESD